MSVSRYHICHSRTYRRRGRSVCRPEQNAAQQNYTVAQMQIAVRRGRNLHHYRRHAAQRGEQSRQYHFFQLAVQNAHLSNSKKLQISSAYNTMYLVFLKYSVFAFLTIPARRLCNAYILAAKK